MTPPQILRIFTPKIKVMKKFKYYYKSDSNKESVGRINAGSLNEAIHISAKKKKLSLKKFLIIFEVEEINGGKN